MQGQRTINWTLKASAAATALIITAGTAMAQQQAEEGGRRGEFEEIIVTADRPDSFGADYVQAGTFRGARQIDTPLTVTVIPETLLRAQQANGLMDALRNSAGVVASQIVPSVYSNLTIRGITVENRGNYRLNGTLPIINLVDLPLENKFRVEALKGASSLYYGFTTPGGLINLTSKRPTEDFYMAARLSGNQYGQAVASAEVSDTWGAFGARLTGALGTQETGVDRVEGHRSFVAGAFDFNPFEGLTINIDVEQIYKTISEPTQVQLVATAPVIPALLDPSTNLGDKWLYSTSRETNLLLHANYKFTNWLSLSGDIGQSRLTRTRHYSAFTFCTVNTNCGQAGLFPAESLAQPGDGIVTVNQSNRLYYRNRMARVELAAGFETGPLKHSLVLGYSYNKRLQQVPSTANNASTNFLGTVIFRQNYLDQARLYGAYAPAPGTGSPLRAGEPPLPPRVIASFNSINDQGYYVFDRIEIGDFLQLLGGVRKTDYKEVNELTNVRTFKATPTTYSGSVVVKPTQWISAYGSYIEGLETTPLAPPTAANPFAQLPASPSEQYEVGIKVEPIKTLLLTAAAFQIDRTSASVNPATNIYEFIGEARFKGVELSASGEVNENLSLYLTALFLDPKQRRAANPILVGNIIENTPKRTWSAFAEYRLPMVEGLAVNAGAYYTGRRAVNATNLAFIPSYTLFNLGGSYTTNLGVNSVTFRVNSENITGKKYWAATGSSLLGQGLPSVIKFSIETVF